MNPIADANKTADFSSVTAIALAKAGAPVIRIDHEGDTLVLTFVTSTDGREKRTLKPGTFPALLSYARECVARLRPVKSVAAGKGICFRQGKTARDKASKTRGLMPTGHGAVRGPAKGSGKSGGSKEKR